MLEFLEINRSKPHSQNTYFIILIYYISMGEAKRRRELGLPPKAKKDRKSKNNENNSFWSKFSFNKLKSHYPAAPFVTTLLVLIVIQMGFSLNSWTENKGVFMDSNSVVVLFRIKQSKSNFYRAIISW